MEGAFSYKLVSGRYEMVFQNVAFQHTVLTIIICTLVLKGVTLFSDIKTQQINGENVRRLQPELE